MAISSGDYLTSLGFKPDVVDWAIQEFSPLGATFSYAGQISHMDSFTGSAEDVLSALRRELQYNEKNISQFDSFLKPAGTGTGYVHHTEAPDGVFGPISSGAQLYEETHMAIDKSDDVYSIQPFQATPEFLAKLQQDINWAVLNQPELVQHNPEMYANLFVSTPVEQLQKQGLPVKESQAPNVGGSGNNWLLYGLLGLGAVALLK